MKYKLKVEGMTCEHCVKAVSDALTADVDAIDISVDLKTGQVLLCSNALEQEIKNCIENQGYDLIDIDTSTAN